jgi:hypothetical protein
LRDKQKQEGKRAITDADKRRWVLPPELHRREQYTTVDKGFDGWYEWEVPFDTDPAWPKALQKALTEYRATWREKMDEVNACIAARADQEELVDQPAVDRSKVRVAGPFTMEGVIPAQESIESEEDENTVSPIGGAPVEMETFGDEGIESDAQNTKAYLDRMVLTALFQSGSDGAARVPFVGIEEPEAAVHPGAAGVLRDALRTAAATTQVVVTSHSPDLLDDKDIGADCILGVASANGETKIGPVDEVGQGVLQDRLYTAGELLSQGQLIPDVDRIDRTPAVQLELFGDTPDAA